ncbi:MAG: primary-amine oxidase [Pseudonocardiaceae bacterium]
MSAPQRSGFRFSVSGQHAACLVGAGFGGREVEAWTFGERVVRRAVAEGEPQARSCQVLPLDDGQLLLAQPGGDVHRILVSTMAGPWRTLAQLRCPSLVMLAHPASGALALAATLPAVTTTVWWVTPKGTPEEISEEISEEIPAELEQREVTRLPGLLTGGTWLDDAGRRLAVTQVREGRSRHLVVDTLTGESSPLAGLGTEVRPILAAESSGLLLVTVGRARCGWANLDSSRSVVYPAALVSTPRRRVWPMALDPAGQRVLLRINEHRRSELAVYDPAADRLEKLEIPPGVVGDVAHWTADQLRFPFAAEGASSGIAELRGGPGGPFTLHSGPVTLHRGPPPPPGAPARPLAELVRPPVTHPLEPLSAEEVAAASAILTRDRDLDRATRFVTIELHEPPKRAVLDGPRPDREAFVVLRDRDQLSTIEAVVSLTRDAVRSWREVPGVQAIVTVEELAECEALIRADPRWMEAMLRRGVTDFSLVRIDPWAVGNTGPRDDATQRRLLRMLCFVRSGRDDNGYAHPVEGLDTVVDLDWMEVAEIVDHGVVPLPPMPGNYLPELLSEPANVPSFDRLRDDLRPIDITQPEGPSFTVDGHAIAWQKWRLRFGYTPREGLILHQVGYFDQGRVRPILYRASLSELYVPYGDPNPTHRVKNVFDEGEWGLGFMLNSLQFGCDCLGEVRYFDVVVNDGDGNPVVLPNVICLHEEDYGIAWKHTDFSTGRVETRRQRRLVLSCVATASNYEYGFYWYFYVDGTIQYEVKLTGILSTGAVLDDAVPFSGPLCGTLVAPGLYAPNHQHFFNVRLDMCVDGERNSVYEVDAAALPVGPGNPAANAWVANPTLLASESQAQRDINPLIGRYWTVVNPSVRGDLNQPVGYKLVPGENILPLAREGSQTQRRAGFAYHHLWVTAFDPAQRYAAGDYPNQRSGDDGLPVYIQADRRLADSDVVVWYTFGAHHVPRPEDWPVMPVCAVGFHLKPVGFFSGNPALDLPRPCHRVQYQ